MPRWDGRQRDHVDCPSPTLIPWIPLVLEGLGLTRAVEGVSIGVDSTNLDRLRGKVRLSELARWFLSVA